MTGTISHIHDHGTIVIVYVTPEAGADVPIYFDHRPFGWIVDGEGHGDATNLIGRPIEVTDGEDGQTVEFLDAA